MAVDLTTIFGTEINVYCQPRMVERQYVGFTGGHGLLAMHLGTRGRQLVVTGTLRAYAASYAAARVILQAAIDTIEPYLWSDPADYSFYGVTYVMCVWDKFQLTTDGEGKAFHWVRGGYVTCKFTAYGRSLY